MKTRLFQSLVAASALLVLGGCDTEQAATTCRAASLVPFATKFTPTTAVPAGTACASPGQLIALASYDPPGATLPSLAVSLSDITTYPLDGSDPAIAQGQFTAKVTDPATSTCSVPTLTPLVSETLTYAFSNMEIYVSAANQGTQMKADLTITDSAEGCTASYEVLGLWPEVPCEADEECGEGSGINPDLFDSISCNTDIGYCMLNGNDFVKTGGDN